MDKSEQDQNPFMSITVLDTFSGMGGFSLAAALAGFQVVRHVEINPRRRAVLHKHWPDIPITNDIGEVGRDGQQTESVTVICGGTPCQGLSVAGHRRGLADERSGLFYEWLRVIDQVNPPWVVWENVPGALSSNKGRDFAAIVFSLVKRGYGVTWRVLDAQYFGVPQRRRRVFLVGHLRGGGSGQVLFERQSVPGNAESRPQEWKRATRLLGTLSGSGSGTARTGNGNELDMVVIRQGQIGVYREVDTLPTIRGARTPAKDGTGITVFNMQEFGVYTQGDTLLTLQRSMRRDQHTLFSFGRLRRITPEEALRAQGFPDGYLDGLGLSDTAKYQMIGDSVAVPVVFWILKRLIQIIEAGEVA